MDKNNHEQTQEEIEKKLAEREKRKRKRMPVSGKEVLKLKKIITEKNNC